MNHGWFCGAISNRDVVLDVYFGTDYHSHLGYPPGAWPPGTRNWGSSGRSITSRTPPSAPSLTGRWGEMVGKSRISGISDTDPQPLLVRSVHGTYAICVVGVIKNEDQLIQQAAGRCRRPLRGHERRPGELQRTGGHPHQPAAHHRRGHPLCPRGGGGDGFRPHHDPPTASSPAGTSSAACPSTSARMTRVALRGF